jgi:hypothetical protein
LTSEEFVDYHRQAVHVDADAIGWNITIQF